MKFPERYNHSTAVKILISIPFIALLYWTLLQYSDVASASLHAPYTFLKTAVDDWIPFVPVFVWPYVIWFGLPVTGLMLAFGKNINAAKMSAMFFAHVLLLLSCYVLYYVFPTSAEAVIMDLSQFSPHASKAIETVGWLYSRSTPSNAFPSYHVAPIVFSAIFLYHHTRRSFWFLLPLFVSIIFSTVLIKFHVFADILGGLAMGVFAYFVLYKKVTLKIMNKAFIKKALNI